MVFFCFAKAFAYCAVKADELFERLLSEALYLPQGFREEPGICRFPQFSGSKINKSFKLATLPEETNPFCYATVTPQFLLCITYGTVKIDRCHLNLNEQQHNSFTDSEKAVSDKKRMSET